MTLKQRVSGVVKFVRMAHQEVWYVCEDGFEFKAEDKGMFFMRWIRKHMAMLETAKAE